MTAPTLTEFLLARIAEDEAVARGAEGEQFFIDDGERTLVYLGHHNPARVLAECEAKRAVIEDAWSAQEYMEAERGAGHSREQMSAENDNPASIIALASVYADHPDYRAEWVV